MDWPADEPRFAAMENTAEGMLGNTDGLVCDDGSGVSVTLENESVWSRFHSLGTEMILTAQGRRMFPCCRFRLSGLQPELSYFLILDITPLDELRHRWNGETWEPHGAGEPHLQSPVCFRDGAITGFKINHDKIPQVCFHPDSPAAGQRWMDGPVSFYKMKLSHSSEDPDAAVVLRPMHRYQPRLYVVPVSSCPEPDVHVFTFPKTAFYAVTSYQNPLITRLKIDCNPFMLAFREDGPSTRLIQNKLKLALSEKHRSSTHTHHESSEEGRMSDETLVRDPSAEPVASLAPASADEVSLRSSQSSEPHRSGISCGVKRVYRRGWRSGARKAKAKWWTNVKHRSAAVSAASMQPDLEHVDGVLFVSFTAKEALDVHVGNMRRSVETSASSHSQTGAEKPARDADWICEQELVLLQQLQQLKNRQIIHPVLQQVGLKLNLLDPAAPIDLHYLGVALPLPSPVLTSSSYAALVSRTGKTSDLTRIKGWMEKFSSKSSADSSAGHSAFSSVLLDEYLEAEGQRISERAAVFSSSAPSPVLYQLPVKSSSYVRTLDSVLQTRSSAPSGLRDKRTKAWRSRRGVRAAPEAVRSSSARLRWKRSVSEDPPQRPAASSGAPSRRRRRYRRRRRTLRFNRDAVDGAQASAFAQKHSELLAQEEQAVSLGQSPTHISAERAGFALSSLLTAEAVKTKQQVREGVCGKDFCRLGCVCESLSREARGSTHCRRVQCMFSCGCFKHKILLVRSEHSAGSLVAFPVAGPGSDGRPEPALRISSLWRRRAGENDPEPLFTPRASGAPRRAPRHHAPTPPRPCPQVQETEKDPVYLYLESMMTCARVREYNSNPPPQVHLLPAKRSVAAPDEAISAVSQLGLAASQNPGESCEAGEPEPTKVLEIISGCNWETHRSLVLKELFHCVDMNHLASVFYIDIYKVELLSKDLKKDESGSTLIYKVCVSLGQTPEKTREPRNSVKKRDDASHLRSSSSQKVNRLNVKENLHIIQTNAPDEKQAKHFPLLSRVVPAGLLKADKKTLVRSGPIKVNGKTYAQAKLILGRMGALHPANRLAAYVTGRIKPLPQNMSRSLSKTLQVRTLRETRGANSAPAVDPSKHTVSQAHSFKMPITRSPVMPWAPNGIRCIPAALNPTSSRNPGRGSNTVAPPLSSAPVTVAPPLSGAETVLPASALPPGQQVVLQPVAGMTGVNMCQFNGQMIQLVPIPAALPVQVQTGAGGTGGAQQEPQSAQMPTSSSQKASSKPLPFIVPRIHAVQGNTGFSFGTVAAAGLQGGLLAKAGMFSFRICPPSAESKTVGLDQTGKAPESTGTASTLLLPGGYRLIKLPMFVSPSVSSPTASVPAVCTEKSTEDPSAHQSSVSIKTEPGEDGAPVIIKVESYSGDSSSKHPCSEPEERSLHIKIEDDTDQSPQNSKDSSHRAKIEESDHETIAGVSHHLNASESRDRGVKDTDRSSSNTEVQQHLRSREERKDTAVGAGVLCSVFEGRTSSVSQSFTKTHKPGAEEIQNRRRKRQAPDDPRVDSAAELHQSSSAFMYSSDGWTTEDSNDWYSEEEVDIVTYEEYDEKMNISLLRAKARRRTQQAAQSQWLLKCKSATHHAVRLMSDLPLYKRTWCLNRTLRERKQLAELQQSLDSLKRTLGVEEDVMMSTQDLLREARQMIGALEEHSTSLMAKKRALIRQHSHYQTLISQRSGADVTGTELQQKTAAPSLPRSPSETRAHSQSVLKRRLPSVILQSFTKI
ncbi:MAX gene-associated protein isoform X2 [Sinocyclocheilus rhinocerous]|uniref:MAX gene-associated protein isoform X2 n=1 Tax=Sinocyclocheilus rhinocerous TaxID=307959 RepID=UPI0007B97D4A|nr:PREDICTED: MAX gene-associated protein-like isoform X2 [Sinocyclocheilus rhinocerous]